MTFFWRNYTFKSIYKLGMLYADAPLTGRITRFSWQNVLRKSVQNCEIICKHYCSLACQNMYIFVLRNKTSSFFLKNVPVWVFGSKTLHYGCETAELKSVANIYFWAVLLCLQPDWHVELSIISRRAAVTGVGWKCVGVSPYHRTPAHSQTTTNCCGCV